MSSVRLIARDELRLMLRNRVALVAFVLLLLLSMAAVLSSWSHQQGIADLRARHQHEAEHAFDAQPDRHPHRVVHYGHFIFRPLGPLAAFDPGVDAFTGNSMFLEGHRQNTANFGDVRQSSLLVRFGQLSPAFVLQVVVPLLLVFLGFGAVARETERGTLRLLMLQGVSRTQLVAGKGLALAIVALAAAIPAMAGLVAIALQPAVAILPVLAIAVGYLLYLLLWVLLILTVSTAFGRSRDALLTLVAIWTVTAVLLPRVAPDVAENIVTLRNRMQTDVSIARDLRRLGDSHNPDDPHFRAFKERLLARYGVARVEDLPFNYRGALAVEGEKLTSALFDRYAAESHSAQARQNGVVGMVGLASPTIALGSLSRAAAGTDFAGHRRFLEQAEAYRYGLVQRLNQMQADDVRYADDTATDPGADRRKRVDAGNWKALPDFTFDPPTEASLLRGALPGLAVLGCWVAGLLLVLVGRARRLGEF